MQDDEISNMGCAAIYRPLFWGSLCLLVLGGRNCAGNCAQDHRTREAGASAFDGKARRLFFDL